jgi:hypothetical protein
MKAAWRSFGASPHVQLHSKKLINWTPPHDCWKKLDKDGASKGNVGAGGLIRDFNGRLVTGLEAGGGSCEDLKAEEAVRR